MGKLFDTVTTLEGAVQKVLDDAYNSAEMDDFEQAYIDAVLRGLADIDPATADVQQIIADALGASADFIEIDLAERIDREVNTLIDETETFYKDLANVEIPALGEAVRRRSDAQALTRLFRENMGQMREELLETTIDEAQRQIAAGNLNRTNLRDNILEAAEGKLHWARTNTRQVIGGLNRMHRDQVRIEAGLQRGLYFGDIRNNTRPFCRALVGQVFSVEQIEQMSNGQGLEVKTFCGGWNCIHSWMWVNEGWDDELDLAFNDGIDIQEKEADSLKIKVPN